MNMSKERPVEISVQQELAYTVAMDWREYEREIEKEFRHAYPGAQITANAKLLGKFSKVERQIDLLIEQRPADFAVRIVVDAKHRGRKIDVSDVEAFIGLTRDVEAHTGMMVALEGFTPAALNRAHNDDSDIILDVLGFEELKTLQGFAGIPHSGDRGVFIEAPFGWVIDATQRPGMVATLYQRGLSFDEALGNREFMYVSFWNKRNEPVNSLDRLLKYQAGYMLGGPTKGEISVLEEGKNGRVGVRTLIRCFRKETYPTPEYTGFVDFEDFIAMFVLFTPKEMERRNLRKLRFLLRDAFPMNVNYDHTARIRASEARLKESISTEERAQLLARIGFWRREMGELQESRRALQDSLSLIPSNYYALGQLQETLIRIGDRDAILQAMSRLLRLDPHNPTVFDECIAYTRSGKVNARDVLDLLEALRKDYHEDELVDASCDFYAGMVLIETDSALARKHLLAARASFRKLFPHGHQVFLAIRSGLQQLSPSKKSGVIKRRGSK
jgi:tetratricopeptide (TPR) repeat protein